MNSEVERHLAGNDAAIASLRRDMSVLSGRIAELAETQRKNVQALTQTKLRSDGTAVVIQIIATGLLTNADAATKSHIEAALQIGFGTYQHLGEPFVGQFRHTADSLFPGIELSRPAG